MPRRIAFALVLCSAAPAAYAQQISWPSASADITAMAMEEADEPQDPAAHPAAIEYSHGYQVRGRIHKSASYAMLPLFATEVELGQSLSDRSSDSKRTAHAALGAGIGSLFAVNTVTGVWNLWEARKDPAGRTRRVLHGLLMLGADAGFLATAAAAPDRSANGLMTFSADNSTHGTIALTSIGVASAGYLVMLFGGR